MNDSNRSSFNFNEWSELASNDPDKFETQRRNAIEEMIRQAPASKRTRLRRLQWRIDQTRKLSGSPMAACIKISSMMWDSIMGKHGLLEALEGRYPRMGIETANIVTFPIHPERSQNR